MIKVIKLKKIIFFVILFFVFFLIIYYKNFLFGNNIIKNRNSNKIDEIIGNLDNYYAEVDVIVKSNKTENIYKMYQECKDGYSMQTVKNKDGNEELKIEFNQNVLKVSNSNLSLEKIYENYNDLLNNSLFLNSFIFDYNNKSNNVEFEENDKEIILNIRLNNNENTYIKYKKIHINKDTKKPTKLEIKDNTQNETICIIYNNIELNVV